MHLIDEMVARDKATGVSLGYRIPIARCGKRLPKRGHDEHLGDCTIWNGDATCVDCLTLAGAL